MNIYKKLLEIQTKLKAPKSQYNSFGKYNYRNCEDILEALKPLLLETQTVLTIADTIRHIDTRFYVEANVKLIDVDTGKSIEVSALAREEDTKKGMDFSQITGSTSSYARKYALNGLFCIDDTKDSDSTNNHPDTKSEITDAQIKRIYAIAKEVNFTDDIIKSWIKTKFKKDSIKQLTKSEYETLSNALEKTKEKL